MVIVWLVPVVLSAVFLLLFVSANPLIEYLFIRVDLRALLQHLSISRIGFWLLAATFVWPFIVIVRRSTLGAAAQFAARTIAREVKPVSLPDTVFGQAAILRSLIVFNILFAVQTVLDALYLWGGVALPDAMSYASYAHRGAYPLIATAILAAAFVIAAMRPGSASEKSPLIRALVFIWVGQNVLLVVSALLRLDLYIELVFANVLAAGGGHMDGAGCCRACPDCGSHPARTVQRLARQHEPRLARADALRLLLSQLFRDYRGPQHRT